MGWFDSIVQGIGAGVNWVKENSGTIGQAASAISSIAGLVLLDNDDPTAKIFPNFAAAAAKLAEKAQRGALEKRDDVIAGLPEYIRNDPTLQVTADEDPAGSTFLWLDPAPLDPADQPNKGLVQDIGKLLTEKSLPTVLPGKNDKANTLDFGLFDVALSIGQAIFSNLGGAGKASDDGISSIKFKVPSGDGSCTITGCHAYYQIPLGQSGPNVAWHAGLVIHKITTKAYRDFESARTKALSFTQPVGATGTEPQWLVTLNVKWEDSVSANASAPKLIEDLKKPDVTKNGWAVNYNSLDGVVQQIKLLCGPGHLPAEAKGLVRHSIRTILGLPNALAATSSASPLTPVIEITLASLVFGGI